jgi:hypothetical protein
LSSLLFEIIYVNKIGSIEKMDRLDTFLMEMYTPSPNDRIKIQTILTEFQAWIISKYGMPEWNNYGKSHIYRALSACARYKHKRYKDGAYLTGLRHRTPSDPAFESLHTPPLPIKLQLVKIIPTTPDVTQIISTQIIDPIPAHPKITETLPTHPETLPIHPKITETLPTQPEITPTTPSNPEIRARSTPPGRRKTDRRHRPAPPKPKTPEVYVPGSSEMPDLDVFIRPHLYRGLDPSKLPKSGPVGRSLSPTIGVPI